METETATMDRARRLGQGSIPRLLLTFASPAIVGLIAQALYYVVDRIFIGKALGNDALAGMTVCFPFMLILMAFGMLVGFGGTALVSIRLGQQKKLEAERVLGNALVLLVVSALLATVLGLTLLDPLLILFGASAAILPYARDYLGIIVLGALFQIVGFGLNNIIRGEGNPKIAMSTMLLGVSLNALLAPLLIFGCRWGMKGAAVATVVAQAVSAAWVLAYFLGGRSLLRLRAQNLRLQWPICRTMLAIGAAPFAMQMAASVLNSILNHQLYLHGGDLAISVMGIIYPVMMMFFMPIFGINQGSQPIIGYNYGAERFDRVKQTLQTAVLAATGIAVLGFAVAMLAPAQVIWLFSHDQKSLAALTGMGNHAMRICTLMFPLVGFQIVSAGYFQAVGKAPQALLLMLSRQVLLLIPLVCVLPRYFGLEGVWAALPTADLGASVLTAVCLFRELRHLDRRHVATVNIAADAAAPTLEIAGP
jgi:putative MATE family efflux protein